MRIFGLDISLERHRTDELSEAPLRKRVQRLEIGLSELEEKHEALGAAHAKLRNHYHGQRGGAPEQRRGPQLTLVDSIPLGDKKALRAYAGIKPGMSHGAFSRRDE